MQAAMLTLGTTFRADDEAEGKNDQRRIPGTPSGAKSGCSTMPTQHNSQVPSLEDLTSRLPEMPPVLAQPPQVVQAPSGGGQQVVS